MLIVDVANVMGSRPDGWWRDRAGAAARLCGQVQQAVQEGRLAAPVVAVLEGAARAGVPEGGGDGVSVVHAPHSGDDAIVALSIDAVAAGHPVTVVTADRELRGRVGAADCDIAGPGWLLDRL